MQSCLSPPSSLVKNREAIWVPLSWEYGLGLVNKKAPFSKMRVKCDKPLKMSERYLKVKHTIGFCVCQLPVGCHKVSNCSFFATIFTSLHFPFYSLPYPLFPTALPHSLFFILLKAAWSINSQGTGVPLIPHGPVKGHIIRCSVRGVKLMFLQPLITSLTILKQKCPSRTHLHFMPVFKCALFASESCLFLWDFFFLFL